MIDCNYHKLLNIISFISVSYSIHLGFKNVRLCWKTGKQSWFVSLPTWSFQVMPCSLFMLQILLQSFLDVHLLHHFVLLWPQLSLVKRSQQKGSMEDEMGEIALQTFKACQSSLMLLSFRNTGTESTRLNVRLSTKKVLRTTWTRKGHFCVLIVLQIKVKFYQLFLSQFHSDIHRVLIKTKPENMIFQEVW